MRGRKGQALWLPRNSVKVHKAQAGQTALAMGSVTTCEGTDKEPGWVRARGRSAVRSPYCPRGPRHPVAPRAPTIPSWLHTQPTLPQAPRSSTPFPASPEAGASLTKHLCPWLPCLSENDVKAHQSCSKHQCFILVPPGADRRHCACPVDGRCVHTDHSVHSDHAVSIHAPADTCIFPTFWLL